MAKRSSISKTAMWILMGLLFLGLGGFGAVNLSGNIRTIGTVGDKSIAVDTYARELQQELRAIGQQTGEAMTFQQAQQLGLDRAVLVRLMRDRALDHEADQIGLSIGDAALRERIVSIPAFQGLDGTFDRDAYADTLNRVGLGEAEFETDLRNEAARQILQGAVTSGVEMPAAYAETLVAYVGETRDFTWVRLDETMLEEPVEDPETEALRAYFDANTGDFTLPATKRITYAMLSPADIIDTVELPEEELRAEYAAREAQYNQPERRLVERLVFANQEAADRAAAALEVNGSTFEALVEERGLSLQDIDLGDVARSDLGAAADAVFSAEAGSVVGPAPTPLGPALFRVNAVLPAQEITFEEAEPELRDALATDRAIRVVEAMAEDFDDRLAGGATLEQLGENTEMTVRQIDWTEETSDDIAAYEGFRAAARDLAEGDFPQIRQLADGSVFAMRLDESLPERPATFEEVREEVTQAWRNERIVTRLTARAEEIAAALANGTSLAEQGLNPQTVTDQDRSAFITGTPTGFMNEVFEMDLDETRVLPGAQSVALVRLDAVNPASENAQAQALADQLREQQNEALSRALFSVYAQDVLNRAGQAIDQRAINAVHVNFQ
ncbi:peptidyl-prolyl cis-trans isomerase [Sulfitobacter sp. HNIBRBA3233]|uniref:peptidyl-prolyl cis-trans isomerase n=1 Tax=Sulfitobacter marinivivus TaxID=3158558 RepID=UPI0032E00F14